MSKQSELDAFIQMVNGSVKNTGEIKTGSTPGVKISSVIYGTDTLEKLRSMGGKTHNQRMGYENQ